jgi:hypothetical protein
MAIWKTDPNVYTWPQEELRRCNPCAPRDPFGPFASEIMPGTKMAPAPRRQPPPLETMLAQRRQLTPRKRPTVALLPFDSTVDPLEVIAGEAIRRGKKYWPTDWHGSARQLFSGGPQEAAAMDPWAPWAPYLIGRPYHRETVHPSLGAVWLLQKAIAAEARTVEARQHAKGKGADPQYYVVWVAKRRLFDLRRLERGSKAHDGDNASARPVGLGSLDISPEAIRGGSGPEYYSKRPDMVYPLCVSPFESPEAAAVDGDRRKLLALAGAIKAAGLSKPTVLKRLRALAANRTESDYVPGGSGTWTDSATPSANSDEEDYRPKFWGAPKTMGGFWLPDGPRVIHGPHRGPDIPRLSTRELREAEAYWQLSRPTDAAVWDDADDLGSTHHSWDEWYEFADLGAYLPPGTFEGWDPLERASSRGEPNYKAMIAQPWLYGQIRQPEDAKTGRRELCSRDLDDEIARELERAGAAE